MGQSVPDINQLAHIEAIKQLKHRYIRCMTHSLWDELETILTEDIQASYSDGKYAFDGREALLKFLRESHDVNSKALGFWHVTMPEISITSNNSASGTWAMYHFYLDKNNNYQVEMFAYYHDKYSLDDDGWKISETGYQRVMEQHFNRKDFDPLTLVLG